MVELAVAPAPVRPEWAPKSEADQVKEALLFTRWSIIDLEPSSLERVAAYLDALLQKEPLKSRPGWANERQVLGCLVTDLRTMVLAAGEPVGVQRDLRDARSRADELHAAQRAEQAAIAYDDLITAAIEEDRAAREYRAPRDEPDPVEPADLPAPDGAIPTWS